MHEIMLRVMCQDEMMGLMTWLMGLCESITSNVIISNAITSNAITSTDLFVMSSIAD